MQWLKGTNCVQQLKCDKTARPAAVKFHMIWASKVLVLLQLYWNLRAFHIPLYLILNAIIMYIVLCVQMNIRHEDELFGWNTHLLLCSWGSLPQLQWGEQQQGRRESRCRIKKLFYHHDFQQNLKANMYVQKKYTQLHSGFETHMAHTVWDVQQDGLYSVGFILINKH